MAEAKDADGKEAEAVGLSAEEEICLVNEENEVVGSCRRARMRAENLPHRATYIFARNSQDQLFVQKRTMIKDYNPGYYDPVSGGVVAAGETYEENAYRELAEEMGIRDVPLTHLFGFYFEDEGSKVFGDAWECPPYDGELTLQPEEVDSVHLWTAEECIRRHEAGEPFTADGMFALRKYMEFKRTASASAAGADENNA